MGTLNVPPAGQVYLDANPIIYSVEQHPDYWPLLVPLWRAAAQNKAIEIVSSDLVLMEALVGPLKSGNTVLAAAYERLFQQAQTRLLPITQAILRSAAQLRNDQAQDAGCDSRGHRNGCWVCVVNNQ